MLPNLALPQTGAVLVGFSGGPDSRLLLHLLAAERDRTGRAVYAAHVNHGIRGDEADRDEAFCIAVAKEYSIPLFVEHVNVPARCAASGNSPELEARLCRYRFFEQVMAEHSIPLLATAHNADDQLETLLLRLLRGTGTKGMGGIPKTRPLPHGGLVVRPLLDMTKADILQACQQFGLAYVTDRTNLEDDCTRNRIRHHVVPLLEQIAGDGVAQRCATRLAEHMAEDEDALEAMACTVSMALSDLRAAPPAIAKRAIRREYACFCDRERIGSDADEHSLTATHLNDLLNLCRGGKPHSALDLPCTVQAVIETDRLCFRRAESFPEPLPLKEPLSLMAGDTPWDGGRMTVRLTVAPVHDLPPADPAAFATAVFPLTPETQALYARYRQEGDCMHCHGMTKKLKKMICAKKIPLDLRDRLPLICLDPNGKEPLWFPGVAFRDGFPSPACGMAVCLTVYTHLPVQQDT